MGDGGADGRSGAAGLSGAAILSVVRRPGRPLTTFLAYHLALGFDHVYLFFDDPNDPDRALAEPFSRVTSVPTDAALRRRWRATSVYRRIRDKLDVELAFRQLVNVAVGAEMALADGHRWLVHLDHDELFYSPESSVVDHFRQLAAQGVQHITYLNHEAQVERPAVDNYFHDVTLFKRNPLTLPNGGYDAEQRAVLAALPQFEWGAFSSYVNGKSAVRLTPGLAADGAHAFFFPEETSGWARLKTGLHRRGLWPAPRTAPPLGKVLRQYALRDNRRRPSRVARAPMILHFPSCGFERFWRRYQRLAPLLAHDKRAERLGPRHLAACAAVNLGRPAAEAFYRERFVLDDPATVERLIALGVLRRLTEPAALAARATATAPGSGVTRPRQGL